MGDIEKLNEFTGQVVYLFVEKHCLNIDLVTYGSLGFIEFYLTNKRGLFITVKASGLCIGGRDHSTLLVSVETGDKCNKASVEIAESDSVQKICKDLGRVFGYLTGAHLKI
jgi:hypothetical protein